MSVVLAALLAALATPVAQTEPVPATLYGAMAWRMIGPFRAGRALAVSGVPGQPDLFYFGAVDGGVWRSPNAGETWSPIFDGQRVASIGALAVAPSDPSVIYVGSGEADMRSDISFGGGMFKSTDAGASWNAIGLADTRQIGRILVDPHNPDVVLVAALGHAYAANPDRGVYRSADGGRSWNRTLFKDDDTGAISLAADPTDFQTIYAALWNVKRPPFTVYAPSDGPGGGLYKSTDAGLTWHELTGHGLPGGTFGRIGVAVAAGGKRVYAIVTTDQKDASGLYRSDDSGASWTLVGTDPRIRERSWYFSEVAIDPKNPDIVYLPNVSIQKSTDGGRTFTAIKGAPGGDDYHALWIDPDDARHMILGSDQGAAVSLDGGATWSSWYNQPTAQMYHVSTDNQFPYWVYGAQQDSGTVGTTSRSDYGQITFRDWMPVGAGESGMIFPDPGNPDIVYGGSTGGLLFRWSRRTGQVEDISPWPRANGISGEIADATHRFPWTSALAISPQPPYALYQGSQVLFRSANGGQRWSIISPDLSHRTKAAPSSGRADLDARDTTSGLIYTIAPSPVAPQQIWIGTDNGVIQLTRDGGRTWRDVTPDGLPMWSKVSTIDASRADAGTAYAAVDRHERDDVAPYLYRTHDFGKTWTKITTGLPTPGYTFVVRADPVRKGLLFAGTELGPYVSFDDGDHWQGLRLNLPTVSIRDLTIHGDDLVAATHGRSFWILDDITPLRQATAGVAAAPAHLYKPETAIRIRRSEIKDTPLPRETPAGRNPPSGAIIDYVLNRAPAGPITLEIVDAAGKVVRSYASADATSDSRPRSPNEAAVFPTFWLRVPPPLSTQPGMNRFVWDLRYPKPRALQFDYDISGVAGDDTPANPEGPLALPGTYQARLTVDGQRYTAPLVVKQDPRVPIAPVVLAAQHALQMQLVSALAASADGVQRAGAGTPAGRAIAAINQELASLLTSLDTADAAPQAQVADAYRDAKSRLDKLLKR